MNNKWNNYISRILGEFWEKTYSGYSFIRYMHELLCMTLKRLYLSWLLYVDSLYIMRKRARNVDIVMFNTPIDDCIINKHNIENYAMSGIVSKQSSVRTLSIPMSCIGEAYAIQDSRTDPSYVWVKGINMYEDGDYMTLVVPQHYAFNVIALSDGDRLTPSYTLYKVTTLKRSRYSSNLSYIYGHDLDSIEYNHMIELWKSHISGVTYKALNTVLSGCIGNDTADTNFIVKDVWREMGVFCVLGDNGKVYHGKTIPSVSVNDSVEDGDLLFTGVTTFNSKKLPSVVDMPLLEIRTAYGTAIAFNKHTKPLVINGVILPDYNNEIWANAASEYCKSNRISVLTSDDPINPLHHAIRTVNPGSLCYCSVNGPLTSSVHTLVSGIYCDMSIQADFRLMTSSTTDTSSPVLVCDPIACISCPCDTSYITIDFDDVECVYV